MKWSRTESGVGDGPVLFLGRGRPYFEFSNWFMGAPFTLDGRRWPSSEHYYMWRKDPRPEVAELILELKTPAQAKKLGDCLELPPDWDFIKFGAMFDGVLAKFTQNEVLAELLISTERRPIHEDTSDLWWGGGPNYPAGRDMLGHTLTGVRSCLVAGRIDAVELADRRANCRCW